MAVFLRDSNEPLDPELAVEPLELPLLLVCGVLWVFSADLTMTCPDCVRVRGGRRLDVDESCRWTGRREPGEIWSMFVL